MVKLKEDVGYCTVNSITEIVFNGGWIPNLMIVLIFNASGPLFSLGGVFTHRDIDISIGYADPTYCAATRGLI